MSTDALKEKLKELHAAIAEAGVDSDPRGDTELQHLLHQLDGDIRALLHKGTSPGGSLASRAQSISARFTAEHPTLAPVLRELTDMLSSMGI